jgi:hypothetical protein
MSDPRIGPSKPDKRNDRGVRGSDELSLAVIPSPPFGRFRDLRVEEEPGIGGIEGAEVVDLGFLDSPVSQPHGRDRGNPHSRSIAVAGLGWLSGRSVRVCRATERVEMRVASSRQFGTFQPVQSCRELRFLSSLPGLRRVVFHVAQSRIPPCTDSSRHQTCQLLAGGSDELVVHFYCRWSMREGRRDAYDASDVSVPSMPAVKWPSMAHIT